MPTKPVTPWTPAENALIVAAYFGMVALLGAGRPINKSAVRRQLIVDMTNTRHDLKLIRSEASVEFKMRNISGVLDDANCDWLKGYAPLPNYQRSLLVAVAAHPMAHENVRELL